MEVVQSEPYGTAMRTVLTGQVVRLMTLATGIRASMSLQQPLGLALILSLQLRISHLHVWFGLVLLLHGCRTRECRLAIGIC